MPEKINEHDLLKAVADARLSCDRYKAQLDEAEAIKKKAEEDLIKFLKDNDLKGFKSIPLNLEVNQKDLLYVSIEEGKEQEAMMFIDEELGRSDVIKRSVHHKTLTSLIGERFKKGEHVPDGLFKRFWKSYLNLQKIS
jgi:hypothetical protein